MAVDLREKETWAAERPHPRGRDDLALVGFGVVMLLGLFLDGWAHSTGRPDSFFTPWHGVLYAGFGGAAVTALWQARRQRPGAGWVEAVAHADRVTFIGLALFAVGAAGDLIWHQTLGIEVNLDALLSPTHLVLMVGGVLALSRPFRSASAEPAPSRLRPFLPTVVSLALATGVLIFFTFYASPFGRTVVPSFGSATTDIHDFSSGTPAAFAQLREMWALAGILFTTFLVLLPVLALVRRWRPPAGSLIVLFAAVAFFEGAESDLKRWPLAFAPLVAGIVGEALLRRRSSPVAIAAAVPAALWAAYFALVGIVYGMGWGPELWSGAVVLSALFGAALALASERHEPRPSYT